MLLRLFILFFSLFPSIKVLAGDIPKTLKISTPDDIPPYSQPARKVLTQAYEKIGIKAEVVDLPSSRSMLKAQSGSGDGELMRLELKDPESLNLVLVPSPVGYIDLLVCTRKSLSVDLTTFNAIRESGLKVGYQSSSLRMKQEFAKINPTVAKTSDSLVRMVLNKRIDLFVYLGFYVNSAIDKLRAKSVDTNDLRLVPFQEKLPVFHYLNKRHAQLVPAIAEELRLMEKDGSIEKIWAERL